MKPNTSILTIREIRTDDLDQVTRVHKNAFPCSLLSRFDNRVISTYYRLQMEPPNKCNPQGVFSADNLVGFCFAGEFRDMKLAFIKSSWPRILFTLMKKPSILLEKENRLRIIGILRSVSHKVFKKKSQKPGLVKSKSKRFGILSIAVDPEFQRLGVGRMLAAQSEDLALKLGFEKISLDVHIDNEKAIHFYESLGYQKIIGNGQDWRGIMIKDLFPSVSDRLADDT